MRDWRRMNAKKVRADNRARYLLNRDKILEDRRKRREAASNANRLFEERIAARMEEMERDATAVFVPNPEAFGEFKIGKRPSRTKIGLTPARTVALRLMERKAAPLPGSDGVGGEYRGGRKVSRGYSKEQAISAVAQRNHKALDDTQGQQLSTKRRPFALTPSGAAALARKEQLVVQSQR
jgi:hypothetical protein